MLRTHVIYYVRTYVKIIGRHKVPTRVSSLLRASAQQGRGTSMNLHAKEMICKDV